MPKQRGVGGELTKWVAWSRRLGNYFRASGVPGARNRRGRVRRDGDGARRSARGARSAGGGATCRLAAIAAPATCRQSNGSDCRFRGRRAVIAGTACDAVRAPTLVRPSPRHAGRSGDITLSRRAHHARLRSTSGAVECAVSHVPECGNPRAALERGGAARTHDPPPGC